VPDQDTNQEPHWTSNAQQQKGNKSESHQRSGETSSRQHATEPAGGNFCGALHSKQEQASDICWRKLFGTLCMQPSANSKQ
jgi:hypothetical protein